MLYVKGKLLVIQIAEVSVLAVFMDNLTIPKDMRHILHSLPTMGAAAIGLPNICKMAVSPCTTSGDMSVDLLFLVSELVDYFLDHLIVHLLQAIEMSSLAGGLLVAFANGDVSDCLLEVLPRHVDDVNVSLLFLSYDKGIG